MADTYTATIQYESLDPMTIGASGDDDKVSRDTLSLEIPSTNLLAAIYPDERAPLAARDALAYGLLQQTHDFREGVESFTEKRTPEFLRDRHPCADRHKWVWKSSFAGAVDAAAQHDAVLPPRARGSLSRRP